MIRIHSLPPAAVLARHPLAFAAMLAALMPAAQAQTRTFEAAIGAAITASDNVNLAPSDTANGGLILEVRPELLVNYLSGRLKARGRLGLTSYTVIGDDTSSTLYPNVDLAATYEALRDWLFIDADLTATRQLENPFAPQSSAGSANSYTQYWTRIAPYITGEFANFSYRLRNSTAWRGSTGAGGSADDAFEWRVDGELGTQRGRLGALYQYQRDYLRYEGNRTFLVEVGRVIGSFRVQPELSVNIRGGYEWAVFPGSRGEGVIYGGGLSWQPTPRSDLTAWWEERFFGSSWLATVSHRTPWLAVSASSSRQLTTSPQRHLLTLPGSSNVFNSIDAILTTRIPDPIQRSQAVRDFMLLNGLPPVLLQAVPVLSDRVDQQEAHMVSVALTGTLNTFVVDGFIIERRGIDAQGNPLPPSIAVLTDEDQHGAALSYSRRLTRADSINATLLWRETRGVGIGSGLRSEQRTLRVQWTQQVRPRTSAYVGARYVEFDSNVFNDYNEIAAFAGIYHRF